MVATRKGDVNLELQQPDRSDITICLPDVYYMKDAPCNLLAANAITGYYYDDKIQAMRSFDNTKKPWGWCDVINGVAVLRTTRSRHQSCDFLLKG